MKYYPIIKDILDFNKIPDQLDFIKTPIINLLSKIYYKDYYFRKSDDGSEALYTLKLLIARLDLPIGDFSLVINPNKSDTSSAPVSDFDPVSAIPISFTYNWEILKYIKDFSYDPDNLDAWMVFDTIMDVFGLTDAKLIQVALDAKYSEETDPLTSYVNDLNTYYQIASPYPSAKPHLA